MTDDEIIRNFILPARAFVENQRKMTIADRIEPKFSRDAGLLAHNGKPSNLTPGQHAQVRTPEFKKWFGDWEASAILNGKSIATLKTSDAPTGNFKAIEDWAASVFKEQGGKAIRAGLGEVLLDHRAAQSSMAHGGANKYKKIAFAAAKDVIERGALVHKASKGDVDSYYFSAPVDIDGVTNIETVLVHKDANTGRMYLHSVMAKESLLNHQVSRADTEVSERSGSTDSEGIARILQNLINGNGVSKAVDDNGEPLVMYTGTSADKDFTKFKMPRNGTWFTKWPDSASDYAMENDSMGLKYNPDTRRYDDVNSASRVMPVFLNIRNEHKLTWDEHQSVNVNNYKAAQSKLFDSLRPKGIDGIQWSPAEWVVIGSNTQIKSAIGNNGDFDGENQGINFSRSLGDTLSSAANSARDVNLPARYKVGDLIGSTPGKLHWWGRNLPNFSSLSEIRAPNSCRYSSQ